jgi:hypothetical protein
MLESVFALRVSHTGVYADGRVNEDSVLITDLDDGSGEQRFQNHKVPVYVPVGGSIEIPLTSRAMFSLVQGSLAGLTDEGILSAEVVTPGSGLAGSGVSVVDVNSTAEFEDGSWTYPWKSLQRGINALYGDPDDPAPAPPTSAGERRYMYVVGGTYDEDITLPPAGNVSLSCVGVVSIGSSTTPRNLTRIVDPNLNPDTPFVPVFSFTAAEGSAWAVYGDMVFADTNGVLTQNVALARGNLLGDFDGSGQTDPMNLLLEHMAFFSPVWNAPTARMTMTFSRWLGGTPVFGRMNTCVHNEFRTGFTTNTAPLATMVMTDTLVDGTVTSPVNLPVDYLTNGYFAANAVVKAGGWAATIPVGRTTPY